MFRLTPHPWHLLCGLTVWCVFFIVIYGGAAVGCSVAPPSPQAGALTWINAAVLAVTVLTTALLAVLSWACFRQTPKQPHNKRFLMRSSTALYGISALATLVVGLTAVIYPPCV